MKNIVNIFPGPFELAEGFAMKLTTMISESAVKQEKFTLALSGGKTPELLFGVISDHFSNSAPWQNVHFFWGDERCVSADDEESNYGMAKKYLLDRLKINPGNIHHIRGDEDPGQEAERYSDEIIRYTKNLNGLPAFDMIMLGIGDDGHTASIFPGQEDLLNSDKICEPSVQPLTMQKRLTLTGRILRNGQHIAFIATGKKKAKVIGSILNNDASAAKYPAFFIKPFNGDIKWFIDHEAGLFLEEE